MGKYGECDGTAGGCCEDNGGDDDDGGDDNDGDEDVGKGCDNNVDEKSKPSSSSSETAPTPHRTDPTIVAPSSTCLR